MTQFPTIDLPTRRFSVDEYRLLAKTGILTEDDRVELLYGEIVEMSPINEPHAHCVDLLAEYFILHHHNEAIVRVQNPVIISDHSQPEPDLVLAHRKEGGYKKIHPRPEDVWLIVEVADSSLEKDRVVKQSLYASAGIPEYWLVNLEDSCIEMFAEPEDDTYARVAIFRPGETIESQWGKGLEVSSVIG